MAKAQRETEEEEKGGESCGRTLSIPMSHPDLIRNNIIISMKITDVSITSFQYCNSGTMTNAFHIFQFFICKTIKKINLYALQSQRDLSRESLVTDMHQWTAVPLFREMVGYPIGVWLFHEETLKYYQLASQVIFSSIWIKIQKLPFNKLNLEMSSAK